MHATEIKNIARGGGTFHQHRRSILRTALVGDSGVRDLKPFLRDGLFALRPEWRAFNFASKDWDLADRVLRDRSTMLEKRMLALAMAYAKSNAGAIARMYALGDRLTGRLLGIPKPTNEVSLDVMEATERQSLFGFRFLCGIHHESPVEMRKALERAMAGSAWCRSRVMFPLINHSIHPAPPEAIDDVLEYFMSGHERQSEKTAIKLLLSSDAARVTPLSYKIFVGLMGHPFDVVELVISHVEFALAERADIAEHLREFVCAVARLLPGTRVSDTAELLQSSWPIFVADERPDALSERLGRYKLGAAEAKFLGLFGRLTHFEAPDLPDHERPIAMLSEMRSSRYPHPNAFYALARISSVWAFVDGGRIIAALLRSVYMLPRARQDLEARDVIRLISLFGYITPFIATAPSAIPLIRRLRPSGSYATTDQSHLERAVEEGLEAESVQIQRLWINKFQWRMRILEEHGKFKPWLSSVREPGRIRPQYLSGINWPWVEEIVELQRLKAFRSFDGAYLLLRMELETRSDPLRLKLVLDKLTDGRGALEVVDILTKEFGDEAPAFVTRYLTAANLLATGRASNHIAAISMRMEALESCIRKVGFNELLTKEMYESETRELTAQLLLLNVNVGKFEVPWESFATYAIDKYSDLYAAMETFRPAGPTEAMSSLTDISRLFKNGHKEDFRCRLNDTAALQLCLGIIEDFLDHPAFGFEMILSGRFRHNNLLQEIHASVTEVGCSQIHPVTPSNAKRLSEAYRTIVERTLYLWCSKFLHSRCKDKPDGLFVVVPKSVEMNELVAKIAASDSLPNSVEVVFHWIKEKLKPQIEQAGARFCADMVRELTQSFEALREKQISECDLSYRPEDAVRVHTAVLTAVVRRVGALRRWFDGVDAKSEAPVSLAQLAQATETLFANVIADRTLITQCDASAAEVSFGPDEVKV
ncbi:MAG TPA: hypothetical protein DCQ33_10695, partial [Nitrospira sp.]|nr:hypothetical protein [Nitrospira sp.]